MTLTYRGYTLYASKTHNGTLTILTSDFREESFDPEGPEEADAIAALKARVDELVAETEQK